MVRIVMSETIPSASDRETTSESVDPAREMGSRAVHVVCPRCQREFEQEGMNDKDEGTVIKIKINRPPDCKYEVPWSRNLEAVSALSQYPETREQREVREENALRVRAAREARLAARRRRRKK